MKTGKIYRVTSPSGKVYIGQTIYSLTRRKQCHESNARANCKTRIGAAIRKYGSQLLWEVIHDNVPVDALDELETKEIQNHNSFNCGYNAIPSAFGGGFTGKNHTDETKKILSEMKRGDGNPMFGKSGELNPFYGKKHTEETKMNWRRADMSGENNPMFGKPGGMLGKNQSSDSKKAIAEKQKGEGNSFFGRKHSEETKRKMRESHLMRRKNERTN